MTNQRGPLMAIRWYMRRGWRRLRMTMRAILIPRRMSIKRKNSSWMTLLILLRMILRLSNVRLKEKKMRPNKTTTSPKKPPLRRSSASSKSKKKRKKFQLWISRKRKFKTNLKKKNVSYTNISSKSRISRKLSRCSPIGLRRWRPLWNPRSSRLKT